MRIYLAFAKKKFPESSTSYSYIEYAKKKGSRDQIILWPSGMFYSFFPLDIILRQAVCLFVKIPKNYASYPLRCVHNRILCSQHSEPKSELWRVVGVINLWPQLRHSHPTRARSLLSVESKPPMVFKSTVTEWLCYWTINNMKLFWKKNHVVWAD